MFFCRAQTQSTAQMIIVRNTYVPVCANALHVSCVHWKLLTGPRAHKLQTVQLDCLSELRASVLASQQGTADSPFRPTGLSANWLSPSCALLFPAAPATLCCVLGHHAVLCCVSPAPLSVRGGWPWSSWSSGPGANRSTAAEGAKQAQTAQCISRSGKLFPCYLCMLLVCAARHECKACNTTRRHPRLERVRCSRETETQGCMP